MCWVASVGRDQFREDTHLTLLTSGQVGLMLPLPEQKSNSLACLCMLVRGSLKSNLWDGPTEQFEGGEKEPQGTRKGKFLD